MKRLARAISDLFGRFLRIILSALGPIGAGTEGWCEGEVLFWGDQKAHWDDWDAGALPGGPPEILRMGGGSDSGRLRSGGPSGLIEDLGGVVE